MLRGGALLPSANPLSLILECLGAEVFPGRRSLLSGPTQTLPKKDVTPQVPSAVRAETPSLMVPFARPKHVAGKAIPSRKALVRTLPSSLEQKFLTFWESPREESNVSYSSFPQKNANFIQHFASSSKGAIDPRGILLELWGAPPVLPEFCRTI